MLWCIVHVCGVKTDLMRFEVPRLRSGLYHWTHQNRNAHILSILKIRIITTWLIFNKKRISCCESTFIITFLEPVPAVRFSIYSAGSLTMLTVLEDLILWKAVHVHQMILQRRPLLSYFLGTWNGWGFCPTQVVCYGPQPFCHLAEWWEFTGFSEFLFQSCNENTMTTN